MCFNFSKLSQNFLKFRSFQNILSFEIFLRSFSRNFFEPSEFSETSTFFESFLINFSAKFFETSLKISWNFWEIFRIFFFTISILEFFETRIFEFFKALCLLTIFFLNFQLRANFSTMLPRYFEPSEWNFNLRGTFFFEPPNFFSTTSPRTVMEIVEREI